MRRLSLLLFASVVRGGDFDEALSRKLLELSAAAYSSFPEACVNRTFTNAEVVKKVRSKCGANVSDHCYGFVGVAHDEKAVFLAFRGTAGPIQLFHETASITKRPLVAARIGGKVAAYFADVYAGLREGGLTAAAARLAARHPDYALWVTGQSLGGALASIGAADLVAAEGVAARRLKLVTFGQPRTGDAEYARRFDGLIEYAKRVVHAADIVAHQPPRGFRGFAHHKAEVWYAAGMDRPYTECDLDDDDPACSRRLRPDYTVRDHFYYYGREVSSYGKAGCVP